MIFKSPIYYSGSKIRNIKEGMIELFPKNINLFIDVFVGSCNVSLNTNANKYILNDKNKYLINLINLFKESDIKNLIYLTSQFLTL